jgi:hypothetical protein
LLPPPKKKKIDESPEGALLAQRGGIRAEVKTWTLERELGSIPGSSTYNCVTLGK